MQKTADSGVQSVHRAFALLELIAQLGGEAGVTELAEGLDLPAPTIHRLLRTLIAQGHIMQLPSRRYSLGPGLIRLGEVATRRLSSWALPALRRLGEATGETANLAVLDGDLAAYVAQVPSKHQMRMFTEVGRRVLPHAAGVGKALLAQLADEEVRAILSRTGMPGYTPTTLTTPEALLEQLHLIRRRDYAIDEGEQEVGVRCFAIPIPGLAVPMAVSISGPEGRVTLASSDRIVQALKDAAASLRAAAPVQGA